MGPIIPWAKIKWAMVRYLVGRRTCVINAQISGRDGLTVSDGGLVADSTCRHFPSAAVTFDFINREVR